MIPSIRSALYNTFSRCTKPPKIAIHPLNGSKQWAKQVEPAVRDFFKSRAVCEVFTSPLTFCMEDALQNLAILEDNHCYPKKRVVMIGYDGDLVNTPFYGDVLFNDAKLTATLINKVYFLKKNYKPTSKNLIKAVMDSRLSRSSEKLFNDDKTLPIQWPEEMLVNLGSNEEPKFVMVSNTAVALDTYEMLDYMSVMSEEEVTTYAKTVVKFTMATNCITPDLTTLPICRGETDYVVVKNFNHMLEGLYITDNESAKFWKAQGLLHALQIGHQQKLRPGYLNVLYNGYKQLS